MNKSGSLTVQFTTGLTMISFGFSQIKNPEPWLAYIPPSIEKRIPTAISQHFMKSHGLINIVLGLLFLFRIGKSVIDWLVFAWWLSILPFAFVHNWKIGMRDLTILGGLFALAMHRSD